MLWKIKSFRAKIKRRKTKIPVYYFDALLLGDYWGCFGNKVRMYAIKILISLVIGILKSVYFSYHHTISTPLLYGLRSALSQFANNGYENSINRHVDSAQLLYDGLSKLGFKFLASDPSKRLPTVTAILIPNNFNWQAFISYMMKKYELLFLYLFEFHFVLFSRYQVEISGGLGPTSGKVLRIGLMGENATRKRTEYLLKVMKDALQNVNKISSKL